jgi:tetratricopeptide (TPR) repeat protein
LCWPDWPNLEQRQTARHEFHVGLHMLAMGEQQQARRWFQTSMQRYPWDPDSPYEVARILISKGRYEQARAYLQEALRREPQFPKAINAMAQISFAEGRLEEARRQALESLRLDPLQVYAPLLLADIERRLGETEREIDYLWRAARDTGNADAAMLVAERFIALDRTNEAVQLYDWVAGLNGVDRFLRVQAIMKAGFTVARFHRDASRARAYWQLVLEDFDDFRFFSEQAAFLIGKRDPEAFVRNMRNLPEGEAAAAYAIGLQCWLDGDSAAARLYFSRCLGDVRHIRPDDVPRKWAREDLARLQPAAGRFTAPSKKDGLRLGSQAD